MLMARSENEAATDPAQPARTDNVMRSIRDVNGIVHQQIVCGAILSEDRNSGGSYDGRSEHGAFNTAYLKRAWTSCTIDEKGKVSDATTLCPPVDDIHKQSRVRWR